MRTSSAASWLIGLSILAVPATAYAGSSPAASAPAPAPATTPFDAKVAAAKGAMMSDPGIALANARQATAIGAATPGTAGIVAAATGHWLEGEALVRLNRVEEAVPIIDGAIGAVARAQPGSKLHADLLKSKAAIVGNQGNIQASLTLLHDAHALYANLGEARSQAMVFQNVGSIYLEARDYPRTLYYYDLADDEFGAVLPFADLGDEPTDVAAAIIDELARPIDVAGTPVSIGATVGMATFPLDARSVDDLIRCADLALYRAKEEGRGRCTRYSAEMQIEIDERRELERDLRCAIDQGELAIAYQPIVDATSAQVVAYEALLRWQHPTRGNICPSVFIPIAEGTQQIGEIGKWVLRSACAEAATWPEHVKLAVNLSAIQIDGVDLTATVIHALATHGLAPRRLELEVTESIFLRPGPNTEATLGRLQSLGVSLALDDFGTGFSSLSYLQRASFSTIKIDRMFVQSAAEGRMESLSIIRAIVALASGLGMVTTAEGVETIEQMDLMRELGCTQLQGFHLGRPELSQRDQTPPIELPILLAPRREIRRAG